MILQTVYDLDYDTLSVRVTPRGDYDTELTTYELNFTDDCLNEMREVVATYGLCEKDEWTDDEKYDIFTGHLYELLNLVPEEVHWNLQGTIDNRLYDTVHCWCESVLAESAKE